jgi:ribosomal protein L22
MTEKDYNPERRNKNISVENPKEKISKGLNDGLKKSTKSSQLNNELKDGLTDKKITEPTGEANSEKSKTTEEKKKPIVKKEIVKKDYAVVNGKNISMSTKHSMAICKFIRGKKIDDSIEFLEKVAKTKKAIPMKGEIPHRKGKMMSGRFPKNASEEFIKLLKSLKANAVANSLNEVIITEAFANMARRPFGRFGRTRKKRTHVTIKCMERKEKQKKQ